MTEIDEQQLRLWAAKVLDEGPYKCRPIWRNNHTWICQKCNRRFRIGHIERAKLASRDSNTAIIDLLKAKGKTCPIPDIPKEPLEVLAFRCRDKCYTDQVLAPKYELALAELFVEATDPQSVEKKQVRARAHKIVEYGGHWYWVSRAGPEILIIAAAKARGINLCQA